MKNIFNKSNTINVLLISIILLLIINAGISYYNGNIIKRNTLLKQQSDEVKVYANAILYDIIHGADLSARGYGITKNKQLADPLRKVLLNKDSIFNGFESILSSQNYSLKTFQEMKVATDEYLKFSQYMIDLAEKDSMDLFVKLLNEDRGYGWWKKFEAFRDPLFKYEDQLNREAKTKLELVVAGNTVTQVLLLLLGIPTIIFIIYRLISDLKNRNKLLAEFDMNNRKYLFDTGVEENNLDSNEFIKNSILNFQTASDFINHISEGNYSVNWAGLNESNISLNENNVAGRLLRMRDQLKQLKKEEERRLWANEGLAIFSELVRNHQHNMKELSEEVIKFLTKYLRAQQGGLFVLQNEDLQEPYLELKACYAFDRKKFVEKRIAIGGGLIGQVYQEGNTVFLTEIPNGYTQITSGLGDATPTCLIIVPMKYNEQVEAIIEMASFEIFEKHEISFLEKAGEFVASALLNVKTTEKMKLLLESSQQQTESMRAAEEEMRQNMEEMQATQEEVQRKSTEMESRIQGINESGISSIEFDTKGNIITANNSFLKLMGYSLDETIGKHHSIFVDKAYAKSEAYETFWQNLATGFTQQGEFNRITKNGEKVILFGSYSLIKNNDGKVERVIKLATDITENKAQVEQLQAAEEEMRQNMEELETTQEEMKKKEVELATTLQRLELASSTTTEGLWDMVVPENLEFKDDTPFYWTPKFRSMLGYKDETDFPNILSSWSNLLHSDHKQKTLDAFSAHLMDFTGKTPYDVEYQLKLKNGKYKWFRAVGNTLRDENGKPLRVAGSLIDIQTLKDLELARKK